jgi:hypothetical protein
VDFFAVDLRPDDLRPVLDLRAAMRTSPERLFSCTAQCRRKKMGIVARARMTWTGTQNARLFAD